MDSILSSSVIGMVDLSLRVNVADALLLVLVALHSLWYLSVDDSIRSRLAPVVVAAIVLFVSSFDGTRYKRQ